MCVCWGGSSELPKEELRTLLIAAGRGGGGTEGGDWNGLGMDNVEADIGFHVGEDIGVEEGWIGGTYFDLLYIYFSDIFQCGGREY